MQTDKHTNTHTHIHIDTAKNPTHAQTIVGVGNNIAIVILYNNIAIVMFYKKQINCDQSSCIISISK